MGRILGLDYGRRRIGVAVSDPLGLTAQPLATWTGLRWDEVVEKIFTLVEEMGVERVILGFPMTLKGESGRMAREVRQFAARLERRISIPITLWDERLTSTQSKRIIHAMAGKPSREKERVDLIASVLLLQNYLDYQKGSTSGHREEIG